ncbi:MAG: thermonuclease family protein [Nitrospinota bacterium]
MINSMKRYFTEKLFLISIILLVNIFSTSLSHADQAICTYVLDGDTIIISYDGKEEKVRLLGVNTPEITGFNKSVEYLGEEAKRFTIKMIHGKKVNIVFDNKKTDMYGRLLAYIYLEDRTFLNAEIIKQGYGYAQKGFLHKYLNEFIKFEQEAKRLKRGLWAKEAKSISNKEKRTRKYVASKNSTVFHNSNCGHAKQIKSYNLIIFETRKEAAESGRRPCKFCRP